ncbi:hypothetical protein [Nonomuraea sp. NPDC050786]|uniref:hypothetical protein n=1 Tax=Nonomuraea sp. NPDC050786 TaxID=3154840 RepID=UPI0033FA4ECA
MLGGSGRHDGLAHRRQHFAEHTQQPLRLGPVRLAQRLQVDPAPEAPLSRLLVPELLVTGAPGPDDLPELGIRGEALRDRLLAGLPLTTTP